jgi:hypothetical protein
LLILHVRQAAPDLFAIEVARMKHGRVKWVAELAHVREVTLVGSADLGYWTDRLRDEELEPAASVEGHAQVLVIVADAAFMGLRFREVSFSVVVQHPGREQGGDATFLVRAFNSRRVFAWCERAFFSTPYYFGNVHEVRTSPAAIHLVDKDEGEFRAEMCPDANGSARVPSRCQEEGWNGPVFLPQAGTGRGGPGKMFFARLHGATRAFQFQTTHDTLSLSPGKNSKVLQALVDSRFGATQWLVREDAMHAKSKTYDRSLLNDF